MMNILRYALVLLTATGFGFGVEEVISNNIEDEVYLYEENNYDDYAFGYCHNNNELFLEHMLERLTDEEKIIVESKIDELLSKYEITSDQLNSNFDVRYNFMTELMEFLEQSGFDYHHDYNDEYDYGNHMGMRR